MSKQKKSKKTAPSAMTPDALRELDKDTLISLLVKMHEQYAQLTEVVQSLVREKHGTKTERFVDSAQLNLFASTEQSDDFSGTSNSESHTNVEEHIQAAKKKPGHGQNPRPAHIKRVPIHPPAPSDEQLRCKCCNRFRTLANQVVRGSRYAYQPASVFVEEFMASIFACDICGDTLVVEPDAPTAVLKLGADPALQSSIAVDRFEDSLPLHRQERRFARIGVPIARSTMVGWLASAAKTLRPLYDRMRDLLLLSKVIATDDTPIKVQDRSKAKNIKLGRVWIYRGDDEHPFNLYDYTTGRGRDGPMLFLAHFQGFLLGDCFSGNQALCAETGAIHVACNAHARRYWIKAEPNNKAACAEILRMYRELFKIESDAQDLGVTGDQLKLMREQEAKPLLEEMKKWLDQHAIIALPKSAFGKAIHYCLNNWTELTNYLLDGNLRIDNNLAEQEMKRVAINRKNWLFFGSDRGGEDAEVFMSLISTCRRHNVEPWSYLRDVIEILTKNPKTDLDSLLPNNWKKNLAPGEINRSQVTPEMVLAS